MQRGCKEFICSCFYSRNIFIKKYRLHVTYQNDEQFHQDFRQHLRMKGCSTNQQYEDVLREIQAEVCRRKHFHMDALERHKYILQNYSKLHPHLWQFNPDFMDKNIQVIVDNCKENSSITHIEDTIPECGGNVNEKRLYQFPVFNESFCMMLVEELSNFEMSSCPKGRPNTMNKYGISLDEMGLSDGLLRDLIIQYIQPISGVLFEDWGGRVLDSFKAFVVMYGPEKDTELSLHYDNAEVTLNVCLTREFEGGGLEFGSLWGETNVKGDTTVKHQCGMGVLHRGRQMHKALPTVSGHRCNLIIWMRSSAVRNQRCPMCDEEPCLVEVPYSGDGFIPTDGTFPSKCVAS